MRVKSTVKEAEGAQVLGEGSIQQLVWDVSVPQAEVNLSLMFVSQLTMQHAVCWHPCQQSPLTSRLKANPKFKLLKKVSLAKAALLGYSPKKLQIFSSRFCWTGHRKQDRDEACSKRLKMFKSKNEAFKRCHRSTTEV